MPNEDRPLDPAAVHALLDVLQAAELAWQMRNVPHIQTVRRLNHKRMPQQARAVFGLMTGMGAQECREFCGQVVDSLSEMSQT